MAELFIEATEIKTYSANAQMVSHGDGECRVHAFVIDGALTMSIAATNNNKGEIADFYLESAADIDALRRYFKMVLDQFASGLLTDTD